MATDEGLRVRKLTQGFPEDTDLNIAKENETALDSTGLPETPLWHGFVFTAGTQPKYVGSRAEENAARKYLEGWANGQIDGTNYQTKLVQHDDFPKPKSKVKLPEKLRESTTAIHEAGHALMSVRLGNEYFAKVSIIPNKSKNMAGYFRGLERPDDFTCIMILVGGFSALKSFGFKDLDSSQGSESDFEEAEEIIVLRNLKPLEHWQTIVTETLSLPENQKALITLASALEEFKEIGPEYALELLRFSDGFGEESELEFFKTSRGDRYWLS